MNLFLNRKIELKTSRGMNDLEGSCVYTFKLRRHGSIMGSGLCLKNVKEIKVSVRHLGIGGEK